MYYTKIPPLLESLPKQKSFGCFSLKLGSLLTGLITIPYTVLVLAQCLAILDKPVPSPLDQEHWENVIVYGIEAVITICHFVTLILTTIMVIGVLREQANLLRPWLIWTTVTVMGNLLFIVFGTVLMVFFTHLDFDPTLIFYYLIPIIALVVRIYMLTLVASYYHALLEENAERLRVLLGTDSWHTIA